MAVFCFFLAAGLFGAAAGLWGLRQDGSIVERVIGGAGTVVIGVMLYPIWIVLIPAAVINHYLLGIVDAASSTHAEAS